MRELANLPNWLCLRLYVEKELIGVENCEILEFSRALDMHNALSRDSISATKREERR